MTLDVMLNSPFVSERKIQGILVGEFISLSRVTWDFLPYPFNLLVAQESGISSIKLFYQFSYQGGDVTMNCFIWLFFPK